jgi:multisubunit Na+/H+ antiporter MnhB subunit
VLVVGGIVYWLCQRTQWRWQYIPKLLQFDRGFEFGLEKFSKFTKWLTRVLRVGPTGGLSAHHHRFRRAVVGGSLVWQFQTGDRLRELLQTAHWPAPDDLRSFVAGLTALAVAAVVILKRWTTQLIALSVAGFLVCFYFVLYRAPDLALTQILIEVVTLFMILILLGRFPRSSEAGETSHRDSRWRKGLNILIALGVGGTTTALILLVSAAPASERLGTFFLEETVPLAAGSNAVNTILVDFRGFDTLGEITVLVIAMLGGLGLLMRYKRTAAEYKQGPMGPPGFRSARPNRRKNDERTGLLHLRHHRALFVFRDQCVRAVSVVARSQSARAAASLAVWPRPFRCVAESGGGRGIECTACMRVDPVRVAAWGLLLAIASSSAPADRTPVPRTIRLPPHRAGAGRIARWHAADL